MDWSHQEGGVYRLADNVAEKFAKLAEAGMGYQFVELSKEHTPSRFFVLFNAEIAVDTTKLYDYETVKLLVETEEPDLLERLEPFPRKETKDLILSENTVAFSDIAQGTIRPMWQHHFSSRLHGSPPFADQTNAKMTFVRYSAYRRDRRVTSDGLTPGTYATTQRDAQEVPSGLAAVSRYALPNPRPAIYRFDIEVSAGVSFLYGSVMPVFGRSGGGAEMEFQNGVSGAAVTQRTEAKY